MRLACLFKYKLVKPIPGFLIQKYLGLLRNMHFFTSFLSKFTTIKPWALVILNLFVISNNANSLHRFLNLYSMIFKDKFP